MTALKFVSLIKQISGGIVTKFFASVCMSLFFTLSAQAAWYETPHLADPKHCSPAEKQTLQTINSLMEGRDYYTVFFNLGQLSSTCREDRFLTLYIAKIHTAVCGSYDYFSALEPFRNSGMHLFPNLLVQPKPVERPVLYYCETATAPFEKLLNDGEYLTLDEMYFLLRTYAFKALVSVKNFDNGNGQLSPDINFCDNKAVPDTHVDAIASNLNRMHMVYTMLGPENLVQLNYYDHFCWDMQQMIGHSLCSKVSDFIDVERLAFRSLLAESRAMGFGTCNGDVVTCFCF